MSTTATAESYWDYIDEAAASNPKILRISSMLFEGDQMVETLRKNPEFDFGQYKFSFNDDCWDLTMDGLPPTGRPYNKVAFHGSEDADIWKLFLLCQLVWKTGKTHSLVAQLNRTRQAFYTVGGKDARHSQIYIEDYRTLKENYLTGLSLGTRYRYAAQLLCFLDFRRTFFGVPIDTDLERELKRDREEAGHAMWSLERTPAIDDEYLVPLVSTCRDVLKSGEEPIRGKITAAVLLLATQIGMRVSEAIAIEIGKLRVSHLDGKPDIAFLQFKTFKGAKGDGGYKTANTIVNPIALEAYLWLEENCKPYRERLGVDTLVVVPKQRRPYLRCDILMGMIREFVLFHCDTIPCIDTQEQFPDLATYPASKVIPKQASKERLARLEQLGLTGDETLVVPKFHSFRATVATKLYEAGVDMRYIRKHMSHISENTTAGYIRSDREIEKANSDLVYRTMIADGAKLIGKHGDEFTEKVNEFIKRLPDHVKSDINAVIEETSKKFPLRRKVGGVCIRCGVVVPCGREDETDQIYCAFGVCPNQCVLYFMAADCLDMVRSHVELIDINLERGYTMAAKNELRKAQNVIRDALNPEIASLEQQLEAHGRDGVIARFPDLEDLIDHLDETKEEIASWLARTI